MDTSGTIYLISAFVLGAALSAAVCRWRDRPPQAPDAVAPAFQDTEVVEEAAVIESTNGVLSQPITLAWIERLVSLAARTDKPVAVVAVARDGEGGAGPSLAQFLGPSLVARLRTHDVVGAWGDDRLLLVLPDTDTGGAMVVAEDVRRSGVGGTLSLGIHSLSPHPSDPPLERAHALVAGALAALVSAQQGGGNQTAIELQG